METDPFRLTGEYRRRHRGLGISCSGVENNRMTEHQYDFDTLAAFYLQRYNFIETFLAMPGNKVTLGNQENSSCRFCGRSEPECSFKQKAHAIPELLGNKSIFSKYECDNCNDFFGNTIENDLGNWSKPGRTFSKIKGKKGVPTIKRNGDGIGWRVEYNITGFHIKEYENDSIVTIDEENRRIKILLYRDPYIPVAVYKAFVRIGLTLLPEEELFNFKEALFWIRNPDHTQIIMETCGLFQTFIPGPLPSNLTTIFILRRKSLFVNIPYAFLIIGYGNYMFQVILPSPKQDKILEGKTIEFPVFPSPKLVNAALYGSNKITTIDLSGQDEIRHEEVPIVMGFDEIVPAE